MPVLPHPNPISLGENRPLNESYPKPPFLAEAVTLTYKPSTSKGAPHKGPFFQSDRFKKTKPQSWTTTLPEAHALFQR